jgi:UDPglucose--hexose-1-phosphate uridylyltransferase
MERSTAPRLLVDPVTGGQVLLAPNRRGRPRRVRATWEWDQEPCHFCEGNELQTPVEVAAVRAPGSAVNGPGWTVRVVQNLYPSVAAVDGTEPGCVRGLHEVLIEGPRHTRHPAELTAELTRLVWRVAAERVHAMLATPPVCSVFLFKNVGPQAGASMEHSHMQILGLPMHPPRIEQEIQGAARFRTRHGCCVFCDVIARAQEEDRVVDTTPGNIALVPPAPRFPFELWLLPTGHAEVLPLLTDGMADLYSLAVRRLHGLYPFLPLNLWLHQAPKQAQESFHWHLEIIPRHGAFAGLEVGADLPICSIPPEEAAARLRAVNLP